MWTAWHTIGSTKQLSTFLLLLHCYYYCQSSTNKADTLFHNHADSPFWIRIWDIRNASFFAAWLIFFFFLMNLWHVAWYMRGKVQHLEGKTLLCDPFSSLLLCPGKFSVGLAESTSDSKNIRQNWWGMAWNKTKVPPVSFLAFYST